MDGVINHRFSAAFLNKLIESISVVFDGEFAIIINLDPDGIRHTDFLVFVMKLSHIWVVQCLFDRDSLFWTETEQSPQ